MSSPSPMPRLPAAADALLLRRLVEARPADRERLEATAVLSDGDLAGRVLGLGIIDAETMTRILADVVATLASEGAATRSLADPSRPAGAHPTPGAAAWTASASSADGGLRLGRYIVEGELGRGGMGVVLRARDPALRRAVAIKVLGGAGPIEERHRRRFEREAAAAARIRHPNVVSVHEVGDDGGRPFIVMDLIEGASLEQVLEDDPPPPRRIAAIVRDVARALHHAHELGLVHRDVKPANILLESPPDGAAPAGDGRPLLTDFGLARELRADGPESERLTLSGQLLGTPAYMAPEQAGPGRGEVGPATDVYALGGVLYRALAGEPPFETAELFVLMRRILFEEPASLRSVAPGVHPDLETIAHRCLEKDPARRYADAAALADDLDRFVRGDLIRARAPTPLQRARRWARRHRLLAGALAAGLVLVIAAAAVGLRFRIAMRAEAARARERIVREARAEAERAWREFSTALADAPVSGAPGAAGEAEVERRRRDRLLALGLEAVSSASTLSGLAAGDPEADAAVFRASMACGEVALQAEQWSVAGSAFGKALAQGVDDAAARAALARVRADRDRVAEAHRAAVQEVLSSARRGELERRPGGWDDALFTLVRYPEKQTVEILAAELDAVTAELRQVVRRVYTAVAEPSAEEAAAGGRPLASLHEAVDRLLAGRLDGRFEAVLAQADRRIEARALSRRSATVHHPPPVARAVIAAEQERAVGGARLKLARLCCDTLGRIGIAEGAIDSLAGYLRAEHDELRAVAPASALCRLGELPERQLVVVSVGSRFDPAGAFWTQIERFFVGTEPTSFLEAPTAEGYMMRGATRLTQGDLDGALADLDRAVELAPDDVRARAMRGSARRRAGDLEGAIADATRAIELLPGDPVGWNNRGNARKVAGDLEGALADLTRAIELAPAEAVGWGNRAGVRRALGDARGAIEDATAAIERAPGDATWWATRAQAHRDAGEAEKALADANRAVELDPAYGLAYRARGNIRADMGQVDAGLADHDRSVELEPGRAEAWHERGVARWKRGDYAGAVADLDRALAVDSSRASAWTDRGLAKADGGDLSGALADHSRALELDPRHANAWTNRGLVRRALGDGKGALADLTRAIEIDPEHEPAWLNRGIMRYETGDPEGAVGDFDRAIAIAPERSGAHSNRAMARFDLGDVEGALADLERAIALDPGDVKALCNRSIVRQKTGDLEGALRDATRAVEVAPRFAGGWHQRGFLRKLAGDVEGAIADLGRAVEADPRMARAWADRGWIRIGAGDPEGGLADCTRAVEIDPRLTPPLINRAGVFFERGELDRAIADLDRVLELEPGNASALGMRGFVLMRKGDREGAVAAFERLLEVAPDHASVPAVRKALERLRGR